MTQQKGVKMYFAKKPDPIKRGELIYSDPTKRGKPKNLTQ